MLKRKQLAQSIFPLTHKICMVGKENKSSARGQAYELMDLIAILSIAIPAVFRIKKGQAINCNIGICHRSAHSTVA
jgi:hypothetical protein